MLYEVITEAVDPGLEAAAATLGARPRAVFLTITLPLAAPGVSMITSHMLGVFRSNSDTRKEFMSLLTASGGNPLLP